MLLLEDSKVLTPVEVANRLRVSRDTVMRQLNSGELPGYKIGGQWRVRESDFVEYLRKRSNQQPAEEK
jgi:excisionase family DNA binding protein